MYWQQNFHRLACFGTSTIPPSAPTGLNAVGSSSSQIDLSWTASTGVVTGYKIYRNGSYLESVTTTSTSDTELSPSTNYCYCVSAYNSAGESQQSSQACAMTPAPPLSPPSTPTGLTASASSSSQINLSWTASTGTVTGYKIYRNGTYPKSVTATSTSDTGLSPSTNYCYNVTAYNSAGESVQSSQACAMTQALPPPVSDPLDYWHLRLFGIPIGFSDAAYGNGLFVEVGNHISTSPDTRKWTIRNPGSPFSLLNINAVTFSNGTFVAVGDSGTILTSADGVTWTTRSSGVTIDIYKITFGNDKFVALDFGGTIITSSDGITWSQSTILHQPLSGITFGNGIFLAVGDNGAIFTSSDANAWASGSSGTSDSLKAITFGKGIFVAVGGSGGTGTVVTSTDGIAWTANKTSAVNQFLGFSTIVYGNGTFVTTGDISSALGSTSLLATSTDGVNWAMTTQNHITGLAFGNDIFVASIMQHTGLSLGPNSFFVSTSTDGVLWTSRLLFQGNSYAPLVNSITFGNGLFVSVGGARLVSLDGNVWTVIATDDNTAVSQVAYGDRVFVSVGNSGAIVSSTDGENWIARSSGTTNNLNGIVFNGTLFVAVGDKGTMVTSFDGTTWTERISGISNSLTAVTYGNGNFVAVGKLGEVLTSQDGLNWQEINSGVLDDLSAVAYGNGKFVATGVLGVSGGSGENITLVSSDTISWTKTVQPVSLSAICFGNGFFVAVGNAVSSGVFKSEDGITWKARQVSLGVSLALNGVTFGEGTFVLVGNAICQSDPL